MSKKERLLILQYMLDILMYSYENKRERNHRYLDLRTLKCKMGKIRNYAQVLMTSIPDCYQIVVQEDCMIETGKLVEVQTTMTGYPEDISSNINYIGFLPSRGYLKPICRYNQEEGMRFFMKSIMSKDNYGDSDYCWDKAGIQLVAPNVYQIEQGVIIGIAFVKNMKLEFYNTKKLS